MTPCMFAYMFCFLFVFLMYFVSCHTPSALLSSSSQRAWPSSPESPPALSRHGTILLELKRRYVSQRLNELQITLSHIRRRRQHDSTALDRAEDLTQTDGIRQQEGAREQTAGLDGHSLFDHQRQDSALADQSRGQEIVKSRWLGNYLLESHISDGQGQNLNLETSQDCQMLENQDPSIHQDIPGKRELNSQIAIENAGQTDIDGMWDSADQKQDVNVG